MTAQPHSTPEADAVFERIRAQAGAGGHPPPSPNPAPSPHGGGSPGHSGSGSSGGGNQPPQPGHGSSSPGHSGHNWMQGVRVVAMAIVAISGIFLILWRTSPAGVQIQKEELVLDIEKVKKNQIDARTKLMREKRRLVEVENKRKPVVNTAACIDASAAASTRRTPIVMQPGSCLTRATAPANFWVLFQTQPKSVQGIASFGEMELRKNSEGKMEPWEKDHCITSQVPDQCVSYLGSKINVPLTVFNNTSPLTINQ